MNKSALQKHEIYNKLTDLGEKELEDIANYIDFMRHKKRIEEKKIIKLEGVIKGYNIELPDLKKLREETWNHVEEETSNE